MLMKKLDKIIDVLKNSQGKFDFSKLAKEIYGCSIYCGTIKSVYNPKFDKCNNLIKGQSTNQTRKIGVYALFYEDKLMKIGQAADKSGGVFHRMSQYYRGNDGCCRHINIDNRDDVKVLYFNLESHEKCWAAERFLQGLADIMGEEMPWEEKVRHIGEKHSDTTQ